MKLSQISLSCEARIVIWFTCKVRRLARSCDQRFGCISPYQVQSRVQSNEAFKLETHSQQFHVDFAESWTFCISSGNFQPWRRFSQLDYQGYVMLATPSQCGSSDVNYCPITYRR